ncbi:MAG TPA: mechanosensitive ion channel domain-containing protein [Burkholderiales bacterium]
MEMLRNLHPWATTAIWAVAALVLVTVACRVALTIAHRLTRGRPIPEVLVDCAAEPLRLLVTLLALQGVWQAAPGGLMWIGGIRHLTLVLIIGTASWLAARMVSAVTRIIILSHPADIADNLYARRIQTQARVLSRTLVLFIIIFGVAAALITFPSVRQIGTGLLASAGLAGLVVGFAAKPLLGNVLAGLQIALTQPIRLDDVVVVNGEFGRIEEITGSYVVSRLWDERRLIVPLQWFIENPFENWTRSTSEILGTAFLWVDYSMPLEPLRAELTRICENSPEWDRKVCNLQVVDTSERAMQLRLLVSAADAGRGWNLRCRVREQMIAFIERNYPQSLPRVRSETEKEREEKREEIKQKSESGDGKA